VIEDGERQLLDVVLTGAPNIKERAWNGQVVFYIELAFEEDPLG
jgi:hypothetical protein